MMLPAVAGADLVEKLLQTIYLLSGKIVVFFDDVSCERCERLLSPIALGAGLRRALGLFERARQIFYPQARLLAGVGQGSATAATVINAETLEDSRRARDAGGQVSDGN